MKSDNELARSMQRLSDEELLDIVEGRKLGYREEAVIVAQEVLRGRGVPFEPVDPSVLTKTMEDVYVAWDRLRGLSVRRGRGRYLTAAGTAALLVWLMGSGPRQDVALALLGVVALIWGAVLLITTQRIIRELGSTWDRYESAVRRAQSNLVEAGKVGLACFLVFALVAVVDALFF